MTSTRSDSASSSEKLQSEGGRASKQTQRALPNWLRAYIEFTEGTESPESFHAWTGLSVLASAVRRNVWLNQQVYLLYPNLYVILVGPPGRVAKSTCIRLGRNVLQAVEDLKFGPDSVTREELIRLMAKAGGPTPVQSPLVLHSTELSSLIEPSGIKMIQYLTDIYDCEYNPKGWKHGTKHSGRDTIINPVLNILAGSTPSWIAEGLPPTDHGFISRTVFVFEDEPRDPEPFPKPRDIPLLEALKNDIDHISRLEGEFTWGAGAKEEYERIYMEIFYSYPQDYRLEGFHNRKKTHLLKIAMLLSLCESDDLIIKARDVTSALEFLSSVEIRMPDTFSAMGKYDHASDLDRIWKRIQQEGGMTAMQIFDDYSAVGDVEVIGKIISHLHKAGRIRIEMKDGENYLVPLREYVRHQRPPDSLVPPHQESDPQQS